MKKRAGLKQQPDNVLPAGPSNSFSKLFQSTKPFGAEAASKLEPASKRSGRDLFRFKVTAVRHAQRLASTVSTVREDQLKYDGVEDIDATADNNLYDRHYAKQIIAYMRSLEKRRALPDNYISDPSHPLTPRTRSILVDWMVQVQHHLCLRQETLYLSVNIFDRFMSIGNSLAADKLQLVVVAALLIGSKIEERFAPEVKDLRRLTEYSYLKDDVLRMESAMLRRLRFNLVMPDPMVFFNRCLQVMKNDSQEFEFAAQYMMDIVLYSTVSVRTTASRLAASAVCLARKIMLSDDNRDWNKMLQVYSGYQETELLPTMKAMLDELKRVSTTEYQGAKIKYSSVRRFRGIAGLAVLQPDALESFVLELE